MEKKERKSRWDRVEEEAIPQRRKSRFSKVDEKKEDSKEVIEELMYVVADHIADKKTDGKERKTNSQQTTTINLPTDLLLSIQKAAEAAKLSLLKNQNVLGSLEEKLTNANHVGTTVPRRSRFGPSKEVETDNTLKTVNEALGVKPTWLVNLNKKEEEGKKKQINEEYIQEADEDQSKWVDPRIATTKRKKRKAFNFVERKNMGIDQINNNDIQSFYERAGTFGNDSKSFMEEKKRILNEQELSLQYFCNENMSNINPNLIEIGSKQERTKKWKEEDQYGLMEKWDQTLFVKIDNLPNKETYIQDNIALLKNKMQEYMEDLVSTTTTTTTCKMKEGVHKKEEKETEKTLLNGKTEGTIENKDEFFTTYGKINQQINPYNAFLLEKNRFIWKNTVYKINLKKITSYIEHPIPIHSKEEENNVVVPNIYLTPLERKKLRKRKRQEKEREKQDKIRVGLIPPPPPKMKLANWMKVVGDKAIANPSKMEEEVRQQMKERELRHFQQNQQRKLTKEEESKKKIKKWKGDPDAENEVCVIYINNLTNKRHIFKIDINAKQLHLTGVCCMSVLYNFIIVEGKHVSVERYKKLLFRRIKWTEDDEYDEYGEDEQRIEGISNKNILGNAEIKGELEMNQTNISQLRKCSLLWSGTVKKKNFSDWKIIEAKIESDITDYLQKHNAMHYYHIVKKYKNVVEGI